MTLVVAVEYKSLSQAIALNDQECRLMKQQAEQDKKQRYKVLKGINTTLTAIQEIADI
jgi:hypothetical protein